MYRRIAWGPGFFPIKMKLLSYGHSVNKILWYLTIFKSAGGYIFALVWGGSSITKNHFFNYLVFVLIPIQFMSTIPLNV